jgi:VanZ family protein
MRSNSTKTVVVLKYLFWAWLILILTISSIPYLPGPEFEIRNSLFRLDYMIHLIEYFVLVTLLLFWRGGRDYRITTRFIIFTLLGGILIASLDEYHQLLIPGRSFNPMDMYANYTGVITGMLFSLLALNRLRPKQSVNR